MSDRGDAQMEDTCLLDDVTRSGVGFNCAVGNSRTHPKSMEWWRKIRSLCSAPRCGFCIVPVRGGREKPGGGSDGYSTKKSSKRRTLTTTFNPLPPAWTGPCFYNIALKRWPTNCRQQIARETYSMQIRLRRRRYSPAILHQITMAQKMYAP